MLFEGLRKTELLDILGFDLSVGFVFDVTKFAAVKAVKRRGLPPKKQGHLGVRECSDVLESPFCLRFTTDSTTLAIDRWSPHRSGQGAALNAVFSESASSPSAPPQPRRMR